MAGKSDEKLDNNHMLLTGGSGSGKTTFARDWYRAHARVVLWDPDQSHAATGVKYTGDIKAFITMLVKGARLKKLRIGFSPEYPTAELYEQYCHAIWQVIDCRFPMTQVTEELQEVTGSGQARGYHNTLLMRSRKFALTCCYISQRPQQIDKSTMAQTPFKATGSLERRVDREAMAGEIDVKACAISELMALNGPKETRTALHYMYRPAGEPARLTAIAFSGRQKGRLKEVKSE